LKNEFNGWGAIETVQFADGTSWTVSQIGQFVLGTSGNDTRTGSSGNDTFYGSLGVDTLNGNGGYDTYRFGKSFGQTTINNLASDGVATANGEIDFGAGVAHDDLWFQKSGNDLQIDLLGTKQDITVSGWYAGNSRAQVQSVDAGDGLKVDSQLQQLVSAMATYTAANPGFNPTQATQMPADQSLQTVIAAAWHS
jgi:Ca2+-binding RTX toxin-like protein